MHGKSERYEIGGTVVHLQVGAASAHVTAPSGHVEGARKVIDLLKSKLQGQKMGFHLREHDTTAHFTFGEVVSGRLHTKQIPDGNTFRTMLSDLAEEIPDAQALNDAHRAMLQSWAGRQADGTPQSGRSI